MEAVVQRVQALESDIKTILQLTGIAGLSYGIIYNGGIVYINSLGYRDISQSLPMTENTITPVCSLTKNMIAAAIGMLVESGKLTWDTPLKTILPWWDLPLADPAVRNLTTIVDCLSHRTGLQMNNYWLASDNHIIIPKTDSIKLINGLRSVRPFRGQFQYNNLGYEIAGLVIHQLTGLGWNEFLQMRLFNSLGMIRTGTHERFAGEENVAECYNVLSDATPVRIGRSQIGDDTLAGAAGGVRSTLSDMLMLAQAWLKAVDDQFRNNTTSTPDSPLHQVSVIASAQVQLGMSSYHETAYAMGFARTQLPGPMGAVGLNTPWLTGPPGSSSGFPLVGKRVEPQLVLYHQGSHPGALSAFNLLPECQCAVVVTSNTLGLVDAPDWIGQMLLEAVLDVPPSHRNDYLHITRETVARALAWFEPLHTALRCRQSTITPPPDTMTELSVQQYIGDYWNDIGTVYIEIILHDGHLSMQFQGREDERWRLYHHKGDVFTWLPDTRDDLARRGRFTFQPEEYYLIRFDRSEDGAVESLVWAHEPWNVPQGERFVRRECRV